MIQIQGDVTLRCYVTMRYGDRDRSIACDVVGRASEKKKTVSSQT